MAHIFNKLGQDIMPTIFDKLQDVGLTESMTVHRKSAASTDAGGGRVKGAATMVYYGVPVSVEPASSERRAMQGDKPLSSHSHDLVFPTHDAFGNNLVIDPSTDRLVVDARGNESAKTFRVIAIASDAGIMFRAHCEKED
jgi:hypothetical protein